MASTPFSQSLINAAGLTETGDLDFLSITRILKAIETRLSPLEAQSGSLDAAIEAIRKVGLDRINQVLVPAIQLILDIQSKGYLIASSATSATLAVGNILNLTISDPDAKRLFTPSPFVALTRAATPDDYAILRTIAYTADDGKYFGEVLSFEGSVGPHNDWVLGALAGSTIAGLSSLNRALTARNEAVAAAAAAVPAAATATSKAAQASEAAAAAIAAAVAAATFDPSSYYSKTQVDTAIAAEATARGTAVAGEATARGTAISAEATARTDADSALQTAIDGLKFSSFRPFSKKTGNFNAAAFYRYRCETGAGAITATLPASPADGDIITIRRKGANSVIVGRNGKTIAGLSEDLTIDADKREIDLKYNGTTSDWEVEAREYA